MTDHSGTTQTSDWTTRPVAFAWLDAPTAIACALSLLLLVAFWVTPFLPMVDLPQHAAQLSIWVHQGDALFAEPGRFLVNWRTPYLGAYLVARVLAVGLGVLPALKLVIWGSVVAHWCAFGRVAVKLGYSPWLALLGLPLALGYGFQWGFISFIGAVPLGLFAIYFALGHRAGPTWRTGAWLAVTLCATLATHGFLLGMTLVVIGPLLLRGAGRFIARVLPLAAPVVLSIVWLMPGSSGRSIGYTLWDPRWRDLAQVPGLMLGASGADRLASAAGVLVLLLVAACLGRPRAQPEWYLPLSLMLLGYCLFPLVLGGFGPLHPRFVAFMVPSLLLAFSARPRPRLPALPWLVTGLCVAWLLVFVGRLVAFTRETQPIADFVSRMPSGLSVRPIVFDRTSQAVPGLPALIHLSAYYAAEKGGRQGYSFAMYPTSAVVYAPGVVPTMGSGAEWQPEWFSAQSELDSYACFLVASAQDRTLELFGARAAEVRLAFHEGNWWAYVTPKFDSYARVNGKQF